MLKFTVIVLKILIFSIMVTYKTFAPQDFIYPRHRCVFIFIAFHIINS